MLFLALSCLQGRPITAAARDLSALGDVGLQLTPGCVPTTDGERCLTDLGVEMRTHHGYSPQAVRAKVWDGVALLGAWDSVHPPKQSAVSASAFREMAVACPTVLETMYPGYHLGSGADLEWAMDADLPLAVDVSHVFIQRAAGAMAEPTWARLQEYDGIEEIHVSANDGRRDLHRATDEATRGIDWAIGRFHARVAEIFRADPSLRSALLVVAQYWDDEAGDAVQGEIVLSQLATPDLGSLQARDERWFEPDWVNLNGRGQSSPHPEDFWLFEDWRSNDYCIPLFAALCVDGGDQELERLELHSPVMIFRPEDGGFPVNEYVGELHRPWLEGVSFGWSEDDLAEAANLRHWVRHGEA